jgi:hypothetical protein
LIPARTTSASTDPLYMVSPKTTACSAVGFQVKLVRAPGAYEAKKISSSSGIARKNSTITPAGPLIHR